MATSTAPALWQSQTPKSLRDLAASLYSLADELLKRSEEMEACGAESMSCRGMAGVNRGIGDLRQFVYAHSHVGLARTKEYRDQFCNRKRTKKSKRQPPKRRFPVGTPASCELYFLLASKDGQRTIEQVSLDESDVHADAVSYGGVDRYVVRSVVEIPLSVERPLIGKVVAKPQGVTPIKPFAKRGERCKEVAV